MVSKEKRGLIVKVRADGMQMAEIARVFCVAESTLYNLFRLERETGSMEPRPYTRGRKPALDRSGLVRLKVLIEAQHDITLEKIEEEMELSISLSALSRIIRNKLGFTYKKAVHASERDRPDVVAKREAWIKTQPQADSSKLVFLDESGCNTNMSRRYTRAKKAIVPPMQFP